jgi:hypothetical protein
MDQPWNGFLSAEVRDLRKDLVLGVVVGGDVAGDDCDMEARSTEGFGDVKVMMIVGALTDGKDTVCG